jgi:hypothetical protein
MNIIIYFLKELLNFDNNNSHFLYYVGHSSIILYKQWKYHKSRKNIATAVILGRAVRLNAFCFSYIIFLTLTLVPRIISYPNEDDSKSNPAFLVSSFMGVLPYVFNIYILTLIF